MKTPVPDNDASAEQFLREERNRLITLLDHLPAMVYGLDPEGRFCLWNRECERVLGYGKGEVLGRTRLEIYERMYPDTAYRDWVVAQAYVPAAREGDKRIILVDGEPLGAINRVPLETENRANMAVGGQPVKSELTRRDREICARLAPALRREGLVFVGIDVIGDFLIEVNVTSPTGLAELARLDGGDPAGRILAHVERLVADRQAGAAVQASTSGVGTGRR